MSSRKLDVGRNFIVRVKHDSDIINFVTNLAKKHGMMTASFTAVGALKCVKFGFYDQEKHDCSETVL